MQPENPVNPSNAPTDQGPQQSIPPAPQAPEPHVDPDVVGRQVDNPLESLQPGERVICEIKRHPIGILGVYFSLATAVLLVAIVGYGFAPQIFTTIDSSKIYGYVTLALLIVAVLGGLFAYIAHIVYWGNRWIVTDDSVTQVIQNSLFNKQSSQLSMGNLEDISAEKNGIMAHLFNYGVLKAETAGAQKSKFHFFYCPNPDYYAKCILNAREVFESHHYRNTPVQYVAPAEQYQQPSGPQDQNRPPQAG